MIKNLTKKLEALIGQEFHYRGENVIVTKFKILNGSNAVVFLNDRPINFLFSEIDDFVNALSEPIHTEKSSMAVSLPKRETAIYEPTKESVAIKNSLMEVLAKVKEDPSFIPQAKVICEVVSQVVNVQKTEIQMLQIASKINGK